MYIFGFFIPFAYSCVVSSYNHDILKNDDNENYYHSQLLMFFYIITDVTVFFFALLELADIRYNGLTKYFTSAWNIFDFTQFLMFFIHSVLGVNRENNQGTHTL